MPYDRTKIANLTIGHCGIGISIGDVDNESSAEAIAVRRYFDHCRDTLLELIPWPFATRRHTLVPLTMAPEYENEWNFMYEVPNFCRRVNKIVNPMRRQPVTQEDHIPFKVVDYYPDGVDQTSSGKVILCDEEGAVMEFNYAVEDVGLFSASFAHALSLFIATMASVSLRVNAKIVAAISMQWDRWYQENAIQAQEAGQPDPNPISSFESERG